MTEKHSKTKVHGNELADQGSAKVLRKMGRPLRAMPANFADLWPTMDSWEEAQSTWSARTALLSRWLDETGERELLERARIRCKRKRREVAWRARCKNYVLGNSLSYGKDNI